MCQSIKENRFGVVAVVVALCLCFVSAAQGQSKNAKKLADAAKNAQEASDTFTGIMNVPEKGIPRDLLDKAEAIGVFEVSKRDSLLGSLGARRDQSEGEGRMERAGVLQPQRRQFRFTDWRRQVDLVLLFMNTGAVDHLMEDKFEIGGEGSAAAGPVGRSASASTDAQLHAQILSYSRSKGLFAGLELKGVAISPDNNDNEPVYGMKPTTCFRRVSNGRLPTCRRV
jgi:lipid-binding SYLF domain-containing protein